MKPLIPIYPPRMLRDPKVVNALREHGVQSPISIEHSLINCPRCEQQGWIGPKQRLLAEAGGGDVICLPCIAADPGAPMLEVVALNPDIRRRAPEDLVKVDDTPPAEPEEPRSKPAEPEEPRNRAQTPPTPYSKQTAHERAMWRLGSS